MGLIGFLALATNVLNVLILVKYKTGTPMYAPSGFALATTRLAMSL
jgi:hypothetical protein